MKNSSPKMYDRDVEFTWLPIGDFSAYWTPNRQITFHCELDGCGWERVQILYCIVLLVPSLCTALNAVSSTQYNRKNFQW